MFIMLKSLGTFSQERFSQICDNKFIAVKNNKFGIIDSLNQIIFDFEFDFINYKNKRLIVRKDHKYGLFTKDKIEILPIKYHFISERKHDRFFVALTHIKRGLIDLDGNFIIPMNYKFVSAALEDKYYLVHNEIQLNGVYDFNGKVVFSENYTFFTIDQEKIFATKDDQTFILDISDLSNTIKLDDSLELIYTNRHYIANQRFVQIVKKDGKFGLINSKNEIIIPIIFDQIRNCNDWRYFVIKLDTKYGLIQTNGVIIKEPIYDAVEWHAGFITFIRKGFEAEQYFYEDSNQFVFE